MAERDRFHDIQQTRFQSSVPEDGYKWEDYNLAAPISDFSHFLSALPQILYCEESGKPTMLDKFFPPSDIFVSEFVRKFRIHSGATFMTWRSSDPEVSTYSPLEDEPCLFLKFAELERTQEAFMSFAESYGLLSHGFDTWALKAPKTVLSKSGTETAIKYFTKVQKDWDVGDVDAAHYPRFVEPLNLWDGEHRDMSLLVKVWHCTEEKNEDELRKLISIEGPGSKGYEMFGLEGASLIMELAEGLKIHRYTIPGSFIDGDIFTTAIELLVMAINSKSLGGLRLILESDSRPIPYIVPRDLLSAMWFQFSQAITGERKYKRCPLCGYWEDVTKRRSDWKRHDTCASNVRAMRYYEKQKEAAKKPTKKPTKKPAAKKTGVAK